MPKRSPPRLCRPTAVRHQSPSGFRLTAPRSLPARPGPTPPTSRGARQLPWVSALASRNERRSRRRSVQPRNPAPAGAGFPSNSSGGPRAFELRAKDKSGQGGATPASASTTRGPPASEAPHAANGWSAHTCSQIRANQIVKPLDKPQWIEAQWPLSTHTIPGYN